MFAEVTLNVPVFATYTYSFDEGTQQVSVGKRVQVNFRGRKTVAFVLRTYADLPSDLGFDACKIKAVLRVIDDEPVFTEELVELARWVSSYYLCSFGEALSLMIPSGRREVSTFSMSLYDSDTPDEAFSLSEEQKKAVDEIYGKTLDGSSHLEYLYGMTGSGKTEVFLQLAKRVIEDGKNVIYLVPEIGLTHQLIEMVKKRFGDGVAVLHSALTPSQKLTQWKRILRNEAKITVGVRSGVFAPAVNLGLIIMDEEHDSSYKSGSTPRYHARQVAMHRANRGKFPLVMGSATPSAEAWHFFTTGTIRKHTLSRRLSGGTLPTVEIVNLAKENCDGSISSRLHELILQTKSEGKQTVLFLNRRGFTHYFSCKTCGADLKCKNCSVSMTYHKNENRLRCHYCGYSVTPPNQCPQCNSFDVGYYGFGTEFIEGELAMKFPHMKVLRADTDTVGSKMDLQGILEDFKAGNADILLGTQLVAKGLNFPKVQLVGIINGDTGLQMPDFRAAERTFNLIVQASGRSGRFIPDGRVIIQSYKPEMPVIKLAASHSVEAFYDYELSQRKLLSFPPFSRLIRIVFRSKDCKLAENAAMDCATILLREVSKQPELRDRVEILGPAECPLAVIAQNYRFQILLRSPKITAIQGLCSYFFNTFRSPTHVYTEIDVDPINLM